MATVVEDRRGRELRGIEHDVLHQLSTIGLLAGLLEDREVSDTERRLRARRVVAETRWLEMLLQVERAALLQQGSPALGTRSVRLDLALSELVTTMRLLSTTRFRLEVVPVTVRADHLAVGRALRNLVWNAHAAAGPEGMVSVQLRREGPWAVVRLDDNGPGFDPRFGAEGTGVGLGVVRDAASVCGGRLRLESRTRGSRVTLSFPIARSEGVARSHGEARPQGEACAS